MLWLFTHLFSLSAWVMLGMMSAWAGVPALDASSFADEVVSFHEGEPAASGKANNAPTLALGAPSRNRPSVTLGCGGQLVLRFVDNALIDVDGPDLYVFEIGPNVEATAVAISMNGHDWVNIGTVAGATASLDISPYTKRDQSFSYVRLIDLKASCHSATPGADIAAVAAIGSAMRYRFSAAILFDYDQATLKPAAQDVLQAWLQAFHKQAGHLQVNGHSDQFGSEHYNQVLSEKRARAVAHYLQSHLANGITLNTQGLGESQPLVQGETAEETAKNRRVEILYFP
ncbi:MAG: OmpA family protein [Mariprofundaceae bacterium]|nr:OmpA family protein [Mariprofundaceae bacterium]